MEQINKLSQELVSTCHEYGFQIILTIANGETGATIRAMDAENVSQVIVLLGVLIDNIMKSCTGEVSAEEIFDGIKEVLSRLDIKTDTDDGRERVEENDSSNGEESESLKN